jgi:D-mannonate dehydratase
VSLSSGKPAPDSKVLTGSKRIVETVDEDRTPTTETFSDLDRFRSDLSVCDVFREKDSWQRLAGYVSDVSNFEQELAVWVVSHSVEPNWRSRNVVY